MYIAIYIKFQENMYELEPLLNNFESICKCRITMHDHHHLLVNPDGTLMVKRERFSHRQTHSDCGYASRHYCINTCMFRYNAKVNRRRCRVCVNHCKYGNIELASPVFRGDTHVFSLFAGMWKYPVSEEEHRRIIQLHCLLPIFVNGLLDEAERIRSSSLRVLSVKEKISEFISDNFNRAISTADLAKHLTLSVSRTCHLVNSCFQCSFSELLTRERIAHAKLFLRQTDYRAGEIAFMCGFSSVEHFNRMFRKKTSLTPLAFRRLFNGGQAGEATALPDTAIHRLS